LINSQNSFINTLFFSSISLFYLGFIGIIINRLHFLSILLCLELLLISLFFTNIIWSLAISNNFLLTNSLILLAFSACEASTGLALLVALARSHNSDLVYNINILQQ
uniref:NADH dehydrogenase subunit 4L n=1 Tax=Xyloplax princealberti TaxID=3083365 RepID=UPI002E7707A4